MKVISGTYVSDGAERVVSPSGAASLCAVLVKTMGSNAEQSMLKTTTMGATEGHRWGGLSNVNPTTSDQFVSMGATSFTVAAGGSRVNVSGTTYLWVAFDDDGGGDIFCGSFSGNGADNRAIAHGLTSAVTVECILASAPWVTPAGCSQMHTRDMGATTDVTVMMGSAASFADAIQQIQKASPNAADFEVGADCNESFTTIHFISFKFVADTIVSTNYPGNSGTATSFAVGALPEFAIVKGTSAARDSCFKATANASNGSLVFDLVSTEQTTRITGFSATVVDIGTNGNVNTGTETYRAFWCRDNAGAPPATRQQTLTMLGCGV